MPFRSRSAGGSNVVPRSPRSAPSPRDCSLVLLGRRSGLFLHLAAMTVTVELPEALAERLPAEAARRGLTVETLAVEALSERFGPPRRRLSFAAIGSSSTGRRTSEAEELLADGFGIDRADR